MERHFPPLAFGDFDAWRDATQAYQAQVLQVPHRDAAQAEVPPHGRLLLVRAQRQRAGPGLGHPRPRACAATGLPRDQRGLPSGDRRAPSAYPRRCAPATSSQLDIHVVSDLHEPIEEAIVSAQASWPGGEHIWGWSGAIGADECVRVGRISIELPADVPTGMLTIDLTFEAGTVVATNRETAPIVP